MDNIRCNEYDEETDSYLYVNHFHEDIEWDEYEE